MRSLPLFLSALLWGANTDTSWIVCATPEALASARNAWGWNEPQFYSLVIPECNKLAAELGWDITFRRIQWFGRRSVIELWSPPDDVRPGRAGWSHFGYRVLGKDRDATGVFLNRAIPPVAQNLYATTDEKRARGIAVFILHEIGHTRLGDGHSDDPADIMYGKILDFDRWLG